MNISSFIILTVIGIMFGLIVGEVFIDIIKIIYHKTYKKSLLRSIKIVLSDAIYIVFPAFMYWVIFVLCGYTI